ncbi:MAG: molybdopterin molybdotransferase MoeA [Terracidiphilus sp.]|nr:molybdopterin molybdotransferase MoeA [Terracidiphilus sp.]
MSAGLLSYAEAAGIVAEYARAVSAQPHPAERLPLVEAASRILAEPVVSDQDQPPFPRSTRDGFACRAAEANTHAALPVAGFTRAGDPLPPPLPAASFRQIMTGAPVPEGADAVAMVEHVEHVEGHARLLPPRTLEAGENIVARAAQARAGDVLLQPGTHITSAQIALAASCGYAQLAVYARPRVAILTTGDELVPVDAVPGPGKIRNSNAPMLAALVAAAGGEPLVLPTAADTAEALDAALHAALSADLLLISGGVSAGTHDLVEPALAKLGARFFFTGIRIQPGKPLVFGELPRASGTALPLFGLPGNPISSAATFRLFAATVLAALAGAREQGPPFVAARLAGHVKAKPGLTRFLPARCDFAGPAAEPPAVELVPWQGSGDLTAFAYANCFLVVPDDAAQIEPGTLVRILLF